MIKKTLVLGASEKPHRYAYKAIALLSDYGHPVVAIGRKNGFALSIPITTELNPIENIDTITLYLSEDNQREYYDYIFSLSPKRIIMNPGAENNELKELAIRRGIEVIEHCTLVMLNTERY
jgi:predicted CoA-binding protein